MSPLLSLGQIKERLAELRKETGQSTDMLALCRDMQKRKAMLNAPDKLTEHCESQGIELKEAVDIDLEGSLVEQAEVILNGGWRVLAHAEKAKVSG